MIWNRYQFNIEFKSHPVLPDDKRPHKKKLLSGTEMRRRVKMVSSGYDRFAVEKDIKRRLSRADRSLTSCSIRSYIFRPREGWAARERKKKRPWRNIRSQRISRQKMRRCEYAYKIWFSSLFPASSPVDILFYLL